MLGILLLSFLVNNVRASTIHRSFVCNGYSTELQICQGLAASTTFNLIVDARTVLDPKYQTAYELFISDYMLFINSDRLRSAVKPNAIGDVAEITLYIMPNLTDDADVYRRNVSELAIELADTLNTNPFGLLENVTGVATAGSAFQVFLCNDYWLFECPIKDPTVHRPQWMTGLIVAAFLLITITLFGSSCQPSKLVFKTTEAQRRRRSVERQLLELSAADRARRRKVKLEAKKAAEEAATVVPASETEQLLDDAGKDYDRPSYQQGERVITQLRPGERHFDPLPDQQQQQQQEQTPQAPKQRSLQTSVPYQLRKIPSVRTSGASHQSLPQEPQPVEHRFNREVFLV